MSIFLKLLVSLFLIGFVLLFFSDSSPRHAGLYKYLGLLCIVPVLAVVFVSLFVAVWAM